MAETWKPTMNFFYIPYFFVPRRWWSFADWQLAIALKRSGKTFIEVRFR